MDKDEVVKNLEELEATGIIDNDERIALTSAVETLKRIDAEKIQKLLSYQHELCSKRISQQIVNYLRGE